MFALFGELKQISCVAGAMPNVGHEIIYMFNDVPIRSDNSIFSWNSFQSGGIDHIVKTCWKFDGTLCRVIRQKQRQRDFRMTFLCSDNRLCCKLVETAVMAGDEIRDAVLGNMCFNRLIEKWQQFAGSFSMADKEAALSVHLNHQPF